MNQLKMLSWFIKIKIPHYVTDKCNRSKHYVPVYNTKEIHGASYCRKTHGGVKVISFKRKKQKWQQILEIALL